MVERILDQPFARAEGLWAAVDRLVDRAPGLADLKAHKLHLLAARRWRALGRTLPADLVREERGAALATLTAPILLQRVRAACDDPLVLLKGLEVARRYPDAALRPFVDVDLLVRDPARIQRVLVAAGFREVGDPELYGAVRHHLRPLVLPGLPLTIEIHGAPKWIERLRAPGMDELLSVAVPTALGCDGLLTLPPAQHALVLAAHAWAHDRPLARVSYLVDVAAMAGECDRGELRRLARRWGIARPWETTIAAADALLGRGPMPWALRVWARNVPELREATVLEHNLARLLGSFWALPLDKAVGAAGAVLAGELKPLPGESWARKATRTGRAVTRPTRRKSLHDSTLPREHRHSRPRIEA